MAAVSETVMAAATAACKKVRYSQTMIKQTFAVLTCALALSSCESGSGGVGVPDLTALCEGYFDVTGTHVEGVTNDPGADPTGCQIPGTYTFTLSPRATPVDEPEPGEVVPPQCAAGDLPTNLAYQVTVQDDEIGDDLITFARDPGGNFTSGKVTRNGSDCSTEFEELTQDGRGVLSIKAFSDGNLINGTAVFSLNEVAQ